MTCYLFRRRCPAIFLLAVVLTLAPLAASAPAHDIPSEMVLHGFVKPDDNRLHFLVRLPLIMLQNITLPTRGPGYVDLSQVDTRLKKVAAAISREIEFFEKGRPLTFDRFRARISQESDTSFETYATALANIEGPGLPLKTNVFWNQGFVDVHLEYPIHSDDSGFSLNMRLSGFGKIIKLRLQFIPPEGKTRIYELAGGFGRLALDPRWHQAAWLFVKLGCMNLLNSLDPLLFIFCLVIPLRRIGDLLKVIIAFSAAHSIALLISANGVLVISGAWFPAFLETLIAASIFYVAIENIVRHDLRYRWIIAGVFGLAYGFKFWFGLDHNLQFAGAHTWLSVLSYNAGIELAQNLLLLMVIPALTLLFKAPLIKSFGVMILSVVLAHTAWHWMLQRGNVLKRFGWPTLGITSLATLAACIGFLILIGLVVWFIAARCLRDFAARQPQKSDDFAEDSAGENIIKLKKRITDKTV